MMIVSSANALNMWQAISSGVWLWLSSVLFWLILLEVYGSAGALDCTHQPWHRLQC